MFRIFKSLDAQRELSARRDRSARRPRRSCIPPGAVAVHYFPPNPIMPALAVHYPPRSGLNRARPSRHGRGRRTQRALDRTEEPNHARAT